MKYVAIIKTVGDLEKVPLEHLGKSPRYPLECVEGDDIEHLRCQFPSATLMTDEQYWGYKHAMNAVHPDMPVSKPWWKFWSKK